MLDRVFEQLQREQIVGIKLEAVSMDSTIVKVHPDGTGALKEMDPSRQASPIWRYERTTFSSPTAKAAVRRSSIVSEPRIASRIAP